MPLFLDISGFEALFLVNYQPLCAASYRIVQDKDIAENIVQDVFRKLWEKRNSLKMTTSLKTCLLNRTVSRSIGYVARYRNPLNEEKKQFGPENGADTNPAEQLMALKKVGYLVEAAVRALPEVSRIVFVLGRYEQMSYEQIAGHLNIPVSSVENHMAKALMQLRKYLLLLPVVFIFF